MHMSDPNGVRLAASMGRAGTCWQPRRPGGLERIRGDLHGRATSPSTRRKESCNLALRSGVSRTWPIPCRHPARRQQCLGRRQHVAMTKEESASLAIPSRHPEQAEGGSTAGRGHYAVVRSSPTPMHSHPRRPRLATRQIAVGGLGIRMNGLLTRTSCCQCPSPTPYVTRARSAGPEPHRAAGRLGRFHEWLPLRSASIRVRLYPLASTTWATCASDACGEAMMRRPPRPTRGGLPVASSGLARRPTVAPS